MRNGLSSNRLAYDLTISEETAAAYVLLQNTAMVIKVFRI